MLSGDRYQQCGYVFWTLLDHTTVSATICTGACVRRLSNPRLYKNTFEGGLLRKQRGIGQRAGTVLQPRLKAQSLTSGGEASANASDAPSIAGRCGSTFADLPVVLAKSFLHIDTTADVEGA